MSSTPPEPATQPGQDEQATEPRLGSHRRASAAGWGDDATKPHALGWQDLLDARERTTWGNFAWFSAAPLIASLNDVVAKGLDDLVNARRPAWVAAQRAAGKGQLRIESHAGPSASFLILGDPGEADASQYAVVEPLIQEGRGTDFMLIASDVIYPAGDINDYMDAFYLPYAKYEKPIYAIPGNHDWYDGLNGFMWHFCGAEPLPPTVYRAGSYSWRQRIARRVWRKPSSPLRAPLVRHRAARPADAERGWEPPQPGPYFAVAAGPLLVVAIDTGITGVLDREQADWLLRVSSDPRPKLLVTGKPIYVNNEYHPGLIEWGYPDEAPDADPKDRSRPVLYEQPTAEPRGRAHRTVDDIVRDPRHRYVAAIGGDTHNYQRYSVRVRDVYPDDPDGKRDRLPESSEEPRTIEYIVSGGGGAYLGATHTIDKIAMGHASRPTPLRPSVDPVTEDDFLCYPLRGDSLARFVLRFGRVLLVTYLVALGVLVVSGWLLFGADYAAVRSEIRDAPTYGQVLLAVPVMLVSVGILVWVASWVGRRAPRGYRGVTGLLVAIGAGLALVPRFGEAWHGWTGGVTLAVLAVVAAASISWTVVRDSGRTGRDVGLALALVGVYAVFHGWTDPLVFLGITLLVVAVLSLILGAMRRRWPRAVRWLTRAAIAFVALLFLLKLPRSFQEALLLVLTALLITSAVAVVGATWRVLTSWPWLWKARLDPDDAVRFVKDRLGTKPERPVGDAELGLMSSTLSDTFFSSWVLRRFISEIAEATRPPFFKSFLRIDVGSKEATITCFGVTGFANDERKPSIEDRVRVALSGPTPGDVSDLAVDPGAWATASERAESADGTQPETVSSGARVARSAGRTGT